MTWLASCSLRWHDINLLKSVCFAVSSQVSYVFAFMFIFVCCMCACEYGHQRSVSGVFLSCAHLIFWDRISLNWSSLCWLDWIASELQGCTCLRFCASASGFYVGSGVQTPSHVLCIHSKSSSAWNWVFCKRRNNTCLTYLLRMVGCMG